MLQRARGAGAGAGAGGWVAGGGVRIPAQATRGCTDPVTGQGDGSAGRQGVHLFHLSSAAMRAPAAAALPPQLAWGFAEAGGSCARPDRCGMVLQSVPLDAPVSYGMQPGKATADMEPQAEASRQAAGGAADSRQLSCPLAHAAAEVLRVQGSTGDWLQARDPSDAQAAVHARWLSSCSRCRT